MDISENSYTNIWSIIIVIALQILVLAVVLGLVASVVSADHLEQVGQSVSLILFIEVSVDQYVWHVRDFHDFCLESVLKIPLPPVKTVSAALDPIPVGSRLLCANWSAALKYELTLGSIAVGRRLSRAQRESRLFAGRRDSEHRSK